MGASTGMNTLKAAFFTFATIAAICICGVGIYSADASTNHAVVDGYGVIPDNTTELASR